MLCDDDCIGRKQRPVVEHPHHLMVDVGRIWRIEENYVELLVLFRELLERSHCVTIDYGGLVFDAERVKVRFDDRAGAARAVDKGGMCRAPADRFHSDCPRPGANVQKATPGSTRRKYVEQGFSQPV